MNQKLIDLIQEIIDEINQEELEDDYEELDPERDLTDML